MGQVLNKIRVLDCNQQSELHLASLHSIVVGFARNVDNCVGGCCYHVKRLSH